MSEREMCISVINSMEEWQLQGALQMLQAMKSTMDKLETDAEVTRQLLADPEMAAKLADSEKIPLSECIPEDEVEW